MANAIHSLSRDDYRIGWICALEHELTAARAVLDAVNPALPAAIGDDNYYLYGRICQHNVVITTLPSGTYGTNACAQVASKMKTTFRNLRFGLLVGIGGGVPGPKHDIRLGDVVVSIPSPHSSGVIQYDLGKSNQDERWPERRYTLDKPPPAVLKAVAGLKVRQNFDADPLGKQLQHVYSKYQWMTQKFGYPGREKDLLFDAKFKHRKGNFYSDHWESSLIHRSPRSNSSPRVFYGSIASGNQLVQDSVTRDFWRDKEGVLCFEMEAAGLMDELRCLVVRGICNYADSHSNDMWQPYAALTAAAYAKDLLELLPPLEGEAMDNDVSEIDLALLRQVNPEPKNNRAANQVVPRKPPTPQHRMGQGKN